MPRVKTLAAGLGWTEVRIPLDSFNAADPSQVRGLAFTAGQPIGAFAFQIDDVESK